MPPSLSSVGLLIILLISKQCWCMNLYSCLCNMKWHMILVKKFLKMWILLKQSSRHHQNWLVQISLAPKHGGACCVHTVQVKERKFKQNHFSWDWTIMKSCKADVIKHRSNNKEKESERGRQNRLEASSFRIKGNDAEWEKKEDLIKKIRGGRKKGVLK